MIGFCFYTEHDVYVKLLLSGEIVKESVSVPKLKLESVGKLSSDGPNFFAGQIAESF